MAATMGLAEFSNLPIASSSPGDKGGLPNSVISAPAMKVRPSQARTPTLISGSCASLVAPSIMATRTPTLMALTGGLLIQMMPTSPRFSNLPCMSFSKGKSLIISLLLQSTEAPAAVDDMYLARGVQGDGTEVIDGLCHILGRHQSSQC